MTDMEFTKKVRTSVAQSLFYDSGRSSPDYAPPILSPLAQAGGTSIGMEYEGADGILAPTPQDPFRVIPDPGTFTGFVTNIDQLGGYRFVRFRATFISNVNTAEVAQLSSIAIPYIY